MLIKKIGTSQLGKGGTPDPNSIRAEDETSSLNTLRQSLGTGSTLAFGTALQDRYEIEQVIGYGGMSTVYRGRDLRFTDTVRVVAVKEMFDVSTDPAQREEKLRHFRQEANTLAMLNHPAIPKIYDFFPANDRIYLILEFVDGKNLETVLEEKKGPLEENKILEWAVELCDVLAYLHSQKPKPVVFRDMKPSNIMLTGSGRLMLVDFGIAKFFQEDKKGTMIGTEGYSPPEQYKGFALPGGDIYALGATLHQLLTFNDPRVEIPFTFHERLPRSINPAVSPVVEGIIMRALEYDINKRWASVGQLKQELLNVVKAGPGESPTAPGGTRGLTYPTRPGTASFGTSNLQTNQAPYSHRGVGNAPPGSAIEALGPSQNTPVANLIWSFATEEEVRSSPVLNQTTVFFGSYDSNLYALEAKTGKFIWKAPTNGGVAGTPCLADPLVVIGSEDGGVYAYDQAEGKQQWVFRTNGPVRSSPRFHSPMLFFGSDDYHVYGIEAKTGRQAWKARTWKPVRSSPAIAQGKIYIGSDDGNLYCIDGTNGNVVWKFRAMDEIRSSPVIQNNLIFVGSLDNNLHCVDAQTGWGIWRFKTDSYVSSSPALVNGKVYFGSVDGILYCLEAKNKKVIWKFNTGSQITSSPRVSGDLVFFGANDKNVYALDAETGQEKWYYPTQGAVPSSPAVANGMVFVGSVDYHLYALEA